MTYQRSQSGLSMVELLVALAISSFLILGVTQVYIDNKRSYSFQQSQTENLESGRYALLVLQQELTKAGYRRRPDEGTDIAFPAVGDLAGCGAFSLGQAIKRTEFNSLCIRYEPRNHLERNCLGELPVTAADLEEAPYTSSDEIIIERLYFAKDDDEDGEAGALMCTRVHTTRAGATLDGREAQSGELVSGLADLRYEFGTGTAADPRSITQYTSASTTLPILAVRHTALMRSAGARLRDSIDAATALTTWQDMVEVEDDDEVLAALKADDSGQLYQISQSNVMLRNLMP